MRTLLHLDSSPRAARSHSRRLTAEFVRIWQTAHPGGTVVRRDVGQAPVPPISEDWIAAAFTDPSNHTPAQRVAIAVSDELVDELLTADDIVIGAPMHNFSITTPLKAWIDQVVRIGRTVAASYTGLVTGKRTTVIATRGGAGLGPGEPMAAADAQVPYLRQILGFLGITDVSVVYAGNLAGSDDARQGSLDRALAQVAELAGR